MILGTDCIDTDCIDTDCIITDCTYAYCITKRAEEMILKHEDDEAGSAYCTIVSVENRHIHGVLTSTVVDTDSGNMMEMN